MNGKKCCFTIYSQWGGNGLDFDLRLNEESIPYNPNPVFLGITFDDYLCCVIRTLKIYAPGPWKD